MITTSIVLCALLAVALYHYRKNLIFQKNLDNHYCKRFVEAVTKIYINPPYDQEDDEGYTDDPILRRALGTDKRETPDSKEVSVRTTIDLEEVINYVEWTSAKYNDQNCPSDCMMIYFRNGDQMLIFEKYDTFQTYHQNYLNDRLSL
jgi:hypothetical protein